MERTTINAPIESVAEGGQVTCRVLSEIEGMAATRQTGLEVIEHGVDPLELGDLPRLAPGHDRRVMRAADRGDRAKAGQAIGKHRITRGQVVLRPGSNRLEGKARRGGQSHAQRAILLSQRDGGQQGTYRADAGFPPE